MNTITAGILFTLLFCFYGQVLSDVAGCWQTWSRCSRWSSGATGLLWVSCDQCCKCKGREGGDCKLVPVTNCGSIKKAYQCQCFGSSGNKKPWTCNLPNNWIDRCK